MPIMLINESILIDAPAAKLVETLSDFEQWPQWSPWLICEPDAELTYEGNLSEVGSSYSWKGNLTGEGKMALVSATDRLLRYDLTFIKPFKQTADVWFDIKPEGDSACTVTWGMESKMPFFMFPWIKKFSAFISMDYRRGLLMLKDLIEQGSVPSIVELGEVEHFAKEQNYIGITKSCRIDEISEHMPAAFDQLAEYSKVEGIEPTGPPQSIYEPIDPISTEITWTAALPVDGVPIVSGEIVNYSVPSGLSGINVTHTGAYHHIGNAWAAAGMWIQNEKGRKPHKTLQGRETYLNSPLEVPPEELVTKLTMFVR